MAAIQSLLTFTRDGEWGEGSAREGYTLCSVIRGTDFAAVRVGDLSGLPQRWIRSDVADRKRLQARDIVIETAGGTKDQETGRTVYIGENLVARSPLPLICASFARSMRCDLAKVKPEYLFWQLQDAYRLGLLSRYHVQHTGVARFQFTDFAGSFEIELPGFEVQARSADVLDTIDEKIVTNRRMNEVLEGMARAFFQSWFVDFSPVRARAEDRPTGLSRELEDQFPTALTDGALGPQPEGWAVSALSDLFDINPKTSVPKDRPSVYVDMAALPKSSPRVVEVSHRMVSSGGAKFRNGDVLLARITPCLENGKTALVDFLEDGEAGWGSTEFIVFRPKSHLSTEWMYLLARDPEFRAFAIRNMTGTSGRQRVNAEALNNWNVVVPPASLSDRFSGIVRPLFERIKVNDDQSRTLAGLRDLLLPKLMSGAIGVKDAEAMLERVA